MSKKASRYTLIMVLICVLAQVDAAPAGASWPLYGRNGRHDCLSPYAGTDEAVFCWTYETRGGINSSPVIDVNGCIYFGSDDSNLYAL